MKSLCTIGRIDGKEVQAPASGFPDADVTVNGNGTWRYPNLGGPAAPTSPQSGATSAAPAAQTSYFYGGDDADNASFPVFQELAIEAASPEDDVAAITGRVFVAQNPEQFTYDADGNMLTDGRFRYTWNAENRLVRAQELVAPTNRNPYTVAYAYDHKGRMVSKRITENDGQDSLVKSTSYLWDGWNIIREIQWPVTSGQGPVVTDNVWGLDLNGTLQGAGGVGGLLAVIRSNSNSNSNSNSSLYFPTYDANGNISEYVSTNGEIVAHYDYSPFGETLIESGDLASSFTHRFSTKPWCPVTGLYEYQMRKYRPVIGRWLSRDPIEEEDNGNLYCHTYNCLVNGFDYLGKQWNGSLSEKGGRVTYSKKFETQNELWYFLGAIDVNISATLELEPDDRPSGKCVPPSLLPFSSSPLTFSPTLWPLGYTTSIEFLWGKRASMSVTSVAKEYGLWTTFDKQLSYTHKSCFWAEEFCKCFNYKLSASISTFSVINNAGLAFSIMLLRNPNAIFLFGTSLLGELPNLTWGGQELIPAFVY